MCATRYGYNKCDNGNLYMSSVKGSGEIDSEIKASNNNIDPDTYSEMLWNEMQLDDEQIKYVANSTKDQRHSAL